jgi:uncharacterized coiled-coil DUF342 family protein
MASTVNPAGFVRKIHENGKQVQVTTGRVEKKRSRQVVRDVIQMMRQRRRALGDQVDWLHEQRDGFAAAEIDNTENQAERADSGIVNIGKAIEARIRAARLSRQIEDCDRAEDKLRETRTELLNWYRDLQASIGETPSDKLPDDQLEPESQDDEEPLSDEAMLAEGERNLQKAHELVCAAAASFANAK